MRPIVAGLILAIFLSRFFCVAESAAQGDTLWIVFAWFVALMGWLIVASRSPQILFRPQWIDFCVALFAGGHIVAALIVIATSGDKRSAINLAWEWAGLLVGWFLLRVECQRKAFRNEIYIGILAAGSTVAGLGLYQHYVDFVQLSSKYGPLFDRLRGLDPLSPEAAAVKKALAADQIPVDGPALILFEKRLRDSHEPLGLFALANNLGGLLAVCFVLVLSLVVHDWRRTDRGGLLRRIGWAILLALIGWCLLLTKSRTAWIGAVVGITCWTILSKGYQFTRGRAVGIAIVVALLLVAGLGLSRFGGLDKQVITEAPKSLRYRLQYWAATVKMIEHHFLFGVGPGQFRSQYLFYKLPEASEEISDPHNLFLDVAANAGLLAITGLVGICAWLVLTLLRGTKESETSVESDGDSEQWMVRAVWVFTGLAWMAVLITNYDDRLLVLLPIAIAVSSWLRLCFVLKPADERWIRIASIAAASGLIIHLMGAGGIAMPAITMLLLSLVAVTVASSPETAQMAKLSSRSLLAGCTFGLVAASALLLIAIIPVHRTQSETVEGDLRIQRGDIRGADAAYESAGLADIYASDPWQRRAELAYQRVLSDRFQSNGLFETAVSLLREAEKRNPANPQDDRTLGQWWFERWKRTHDLADAKESIQNYRRAWEGYPTNAILMAEYAIALEAAGETQAAVEMAKKSLKQDQLNHSMTHVDRYLPDTLREQLGKINGVLLDQ